MEEWVGRQWDRWITRAAEARHAHAAVRLEAVERSIGLLFRAAGGAATVRVAAAGQTGVGGPRGWLQRLAGSGSQAALPALQPEVLALPAEIAVFEDAALNRSLYLWLAALAAHWPPATEDWLAGNQAATRAALATFPGLRARHAALLAAHLAQRPDPARLRPAAAAAERQVQRALRTDTALLPCTDPTAAWPDRVQDPGRPLCPDQVAPVWLWIDARSASAAECAVRPAAGPEAGASPAHPAQRDRQRRCAEAVRDERHAAPLMMFFRAESILSWGEFVKVNRASDDDENAHALAAANDLQVLAIAPDGRSAASRVKFDLDLPSAAADDQPLGPGERLPEWDCKQGRLLPGHCAVQRRIHPAAPDYQPSPALRATARRVRRRLEVLRAAPGRARAQTEGEEIDLDAWVRHRVEAACAPRTESPAVFTRRVRSERSLATLLLADLSLSTDAHASNTARVIDVIRDALYVFGEALSANGDPFEMIGFSSVRRHNVRIQHLKGFDEPWSAAARARVGAIKPGYYTRMGAAIRHATARLAERPERQRLLLILTDGKPNDLDVYEGRYGLEDTRHAVQAARASGLTPFCVTIDEAAHDYLPMLFGQQGYALVHRPQDLVQRLAQVHGQLTR